ITAARLFRQVPDNSRHADAAFQELLPSVPEAQFIERQDASASGWLDRSSVDAQRPANLQCCYHFKDHVGSTVGSGLLISSARLTATIFLCNPASSTPAPYPVTASGADSVSVAAIALAAVVLPIPISPMPINSMPSAAADRARSIPVTTDRMASSRVIAGPRVKFAVPRRTFDRINPGASSRLASTPASTTLTSIPPCLASTLIAAPPRRKL